MTRIGLRFKRTTDELFFSYAYIGDTAPNVVSVYFDKDLDSEYAVDPDYNFIVTFNGVSIPIIYIIMDIGGDRKRVALGLDPSGAAGLTGDHVGLVTYRRGALALAGLNGEVVGEFTNKPIVNIL